jgi:hypothetical protein
MQEFIPKMMHLIGDAKASPDISMERDLPFLVDLETQILQYVRAPLEEAGVPTGEGSPMAPDAMMGGEMGGGMPMGGPPMGQQVPAGLTPGIPTENMVSELRRSIG